MMALEDDDVKGKTIDPQGYAITEYKWLGSMLGGFIFGTEVLAVWLIARDRCERD